MPFPMPATSTADKPAQAPQPDPFYVARQLCFDFTVNSTSIVGSVIPAAYPCPRCSGTRLIVGSSRGPHHDSLTCANCKRHLGWLTGWQYRALTAAQIVEGSVLASSFSFKTGLSSATVPW